MLRFNPLHAQFVNRQITNKISKLISYRSPNVTSPLQKSKNFQQNHKTDRKKTTLAFPRIDVYSLYKGLVALFIGAFLSACVSERSYQETHTINFAGSPNAIVETTSGSYRQAGINAPMYGSIAVNTPHVTVGVSHTSPVYYPKSQPYISNTRTYSNGQTTITRGTTVLPSYVCTQHVTRNGQTTVYEVPCQSMRPHYR